MRVKMDDFKKRKHDEDEDDEAAIGVLRRFEQVKLLREDSAKKLVIVEGQIAPESSNEDGSRVNKAVLILEKKPFVVDDIEDFVHSANSKLTFVNDCYSNYQLAPSKLNHDVKVTLINPATEKHILKYTEQEFFIVHETKEIYNSVTMPLLEEQGFSVEWVHNILDKKAEVDKVIFEDPDLRHGFVLLPDMKWNGTELESLYLVAIAHNRNLKSIRDLNRSHLPLLKNILEQSTRIISEVYGVAPCKLRLYCHYEPSYYHFHVHINHIRLDCAGKDIMRAHLLSDIIDNIEMKSNYYQEKTLSYLVAENTLLFKELKNRGHIDDNQVPLLNEF